MIWLKQINLNDIQVAFFSYFKGAAKHQDGDVMIVLYENGNFWRYCGEIIPAEQMDLFTNVVTIKDRWNEREPVDLQEGNTYLKEFLVTQMEENFPATKKFIEYCNDKFKLH